MIIGYIILLSFIKQVSILPLERWNWSWGVYIWHLSTNLHRYLPSKWYNRIISIHVSIVFLFYKINLAVIFNQANFWWIIVSRCTTNRSFFCRTGGKSNEINIKQMIEFLNEKQRDPRLNEILYPHYNENRVMEIIRTYEKDTVLIDKGLLSKEVMPLNPINNLY